MGGAPKGADAHLMPPAIGDNTNAITVTQVAVAITTIDQIGIWSTTLMRSAETSAPSTTTRQCMTPTFE